MTSALICNREVVRVFDGAVPDRLTLSDKMEVHGASVGWSDGDYAIVPAIYDDAPTNSFETGRTTALVDGIVEISRMWELAPVYVPSSCSRIQGLLALLRAGIPDPKAAIAKAIAAIPDPVERMAMEIKVEEPVWQRSNPLIAQLGAALGFDEKQIDALFTAAQEH
jgi:hypothetical protein